MKTRNHLWCLLLLSGALSASGFGQSGIAYRRSSVMNGNQVRTVFGNWGVIGQPIDTRPRGSWKNDNDGYLGDVSPFIGAEVRWKDTTFHSVLTSPVGRPTEERDQSPDGKDWTLEPVAGYFAAPPNQDIALSNNKSTWPEQWPDKLNDALDPGWKGSWNGYFGKRVGADQETYFVMDDNNDERFNSARNNGRGIAFKPDSTNLSRNGLGIEVRVRALQWAQFLAQDNIFWLYEISNTGTTTYDRTVFGMLVGTYVGVTGQADNGEYDDDWSFYDALTNLTYTGDYDQDASRNPRWVGSVGMVGYAFLETPGNPFDGIDNDGDADSLGAGATFPRFSASSFSDSSVIKPGDRLVSISNDFSRALFTVSNRDSVRVWTRGMKDSVWIYPGKTKRVPEGNIVKDVTSNDVVNRNAFDGIDNNFNGLIDENQYVHYEQIKRNRNPPFQLLFDQFRKLRYVDYLNGRVNNPTSMIDEKRDDLVDNNNDWSRDRPNGSLLTDTQGRLLDDVGLDGIGPLAVNYPGRDFGEGDGFPTSGYAKPELNQPGEPHVDKTDVNESDQIGLTSFFYFTPANQVRMGDKEYLWRSLAPGFFDVPLSIQFVEGVGKSFPTQGQDGDFIYGSGYFPLRAKTTERFSLALVYGGGKGRGTPWSVEIDDLLKNKKTVQKIYDANYQFPTPPEPPTVVAVPGDHQVTLYWDRASENFIDPVLKVPTFEGYKIYKSTDPDFSDIYTITDANGTKRGYRPIAQYDLKNGVKGYYRASPVLFTDASGYSIYLGDDTGLQHTFVDREVDNGRNYYYAVVSYTRGEEVVGIFPAENTKSVRISSTGEVSNKDINVVVAMPNAKVAGYTRVADGVKLDHLAGPGTGNVSYSIVDSRQLVPHRYRLEFLDTQVDGVDNIYPADSTKGRGRIDAADSTEWDRLTSFYSVRDLQVVSEDFVSQDTLLISLKRKNLYPGSAVVKDSRGTVVSPSNYLLNETKGSIRGTTTGTLPGGTYSISYQYYPVFKSPHIQGTPLLVENRDADIFDGLTLNFDNFFYVKDTLSTWVGKNAYRYNFAAVDYPRLDPPLKGYKRPADYEIQFSSTIADTSSVGPLPFDIPIPVRFRVYNVTEGTYVKFLFAKGLVTPEDRIAPLDDLILLEQNPRGTLYPTWEVFFISKEGDRPDTVYNLTTGDKLVLRTTKPFRQGDVFEFTPVLPKVDAKAASSSLERIRVVPNPYVTAAAFEPPLNPGITSGRGTRKIDFIHLPAEARINIYTSRGDHVVTLRQDGNIEDGTVSWNLRTKENLDVAFGIYFYVVESPAGNKTGKIAIIK